MTTQSLPDSLEFVYKNGKNLMRKRFDFSAKHAFYTIKSLPCDFNNWLIKPVNPAWKLRPCPASARAALIGPFALSGTKIVIADFPCRLACFVCLI